jgi:TP901 family phage tail tape measure protein
MTEFGATAGATGTKLSSMLSAAATGVVAMGVAFAGVAADQAFKFQESLDKIQNQAGLTAAQTDALGKSILNISNQTGVSAQALSASALTISQAGVKGAAATELLTAAAKAAVITNASVADTTKAIVAAQTLQIAKGMDVTKLTGILVQGSKEFVGGLAAEEQMLSGRVAVALSNYGINLKTIIALGAEFAKVGLKSRSIATFANALGALEKPMVDSKGKLTSFAQGLEKVGLSYSQLASMAKAGNIAGILNDIKAAAATSGASLSQVANAVFGATGGASASVLIKNLQQVQQIQQQMTGSGAGSLQSGFQNAIKQLGPQLTLLKTQLINLMISAGKMLLPALSDVVHWANGIFAWFDAHPLIRKIADDAAIAIFVAAVGVKLAAAIDSLLAKAAATFGSEIAAETAGAGAVGAAETVGGALVGTLGGAAALTAAAGVGLLLAAKGGPNSAKMTKQQKEESRSAAPISKSAKVTPVAKSTTKNIAKTNVIIHYKKA